MAMKINVRKLFTEFYEGYTGREELSLEDMMQNYLPDRSKADLAEALDTMRRSYVQGCRDMAAKPGKKEGGAFWARVASEDRAPSPSEEKGAAIFLHQYVVHSLYGEEMTGEEAEEIAAMEGPQVREQVLRDIRELGQEQLLDMVQMTSRLNGTQAYLDAGETLDASDETRRDLTLASLYVYYCTCVPEDGAFDVRRVQELLGYAAGVQNEAFRQVREEPGRRGRISEDAQELITAALLLVLMFTPVALFSVPAIEGFFATETLLSTVTWTVLMTLWYGGLLTGLLSLTGNLELEVSPRRTARIARRKSRQALIDAFFDEAPTTPPNAGTRTAQDVQGADTIQQAEPDRRVMQL